MPFKNDERRREYQKRWKKKERERKKKLKKQAREELLKVFSPVQIEKEIPSVATVIFGKTFQKLTEKMVLSQRSIEKKPSRKKLSRREPRKKKQKKSSRDKEEQTYPLW